MFKLSANGAAPFLTPDASADLRTARTMDHLLALMGVTALGAGGLRAAIGVGNQLKSRKSIRGWPPSRKAVVELPFREKTARRHPIIDAADNMRRLNVQRATDSPGQQTADRQSAIAANLAKTRANRSLPGYQQSFAHTNLNPYGSPATGTPPAASPTPPGLDPHAYAAAVQARYNAGLANTVRNQKQQSSLADAAVQKFQQGSLATSPGNRLGVPNPSRDYSGGMSPSIPAAVGTARSVLTPKPPVLGGPTVKPPVAPSPAAASMPKPPGWDTLSGNQPVKLAVDGFAPSGVAQKLTRLLGLTREGSSPSLLRDLVNPVHATHVWEMPWVMGAAPIGAIGAGYAGWKAVEKADKAYRDLDARMEIGDAKSRYERALKRRVLSKSAAEKPTLDDLAERYVKRALDLGDLASIPLSTMLLLGGTGAALGGIKGLSDSTEGKTLLQKAVRERQRDIAAGPPRPIVVGPKAIKDRDLAEFESED